MSRCTPLLQLAGLRGPHEAGRPAYGRGPRDRERCRTRDHQCVRPPRPPRPQGRPGARRRATSSTSPPSPAASSETVADLSDAAGRRAAQAPGGTGQQALDRDLEVHRLTARLRALRRFGLDLCLGRIVRADDPRAAVRRAARARRPRRPAAARRLALAGGRAVLRRHARATRWGWPAAAATGGRAAGSPTTGTRSSPRTGATSSAALDDQSAFIASLGADRSPRMRDVLGTISADQDAIIRADSRGALVVDGGPGTGKTVVALHRAAYLLHADPRLAAGAGGVLFVGPHAALPGLRRRRPARAGGGGRADLHPARPRRRGRDGRAGGRPGGGRAQGVRGARRRGRGGRPVLRGAADASR